MCERVSCGTAGSAQRVPYGAKLREHELGDVDEQVVLLGALGGLRVAVDVGVVVLLPAAVGVAQQLEDAAQKALRKRQQRVGALSAMRGGRRRTPEERWRQMRRMK